uniref:Uncharacterized protein n=1 Tax=Physcomitrium patens TaxID=3218 RepID=A0A7I4DJQ3_PHYPA
MVLRIKRNKERSTISYNKFKIDSTRVISKAHTHYKIELELLDDDCEIKLLELTLERIRPSTVPQIFKLINKLVLSLDLRSYKLPKPVDITIKELARNYSSGGSVSLKLDGTRSFLACYEATVYAISTKGEETIIESGFGGDITKWDHYKSVTCVDPSYNNIKEVKRRLGTNKKKHHLLLLQALIIMDTRNKILTLTPMLLSRAPKKVYSSPAQKSHKYFSQKVEEIDTSEVFTYTPEKVLSKEKIKYVVSRTVNRNMLVAIDLLKQLKNTNNISNISSADFEALITKPLDKFLNGRVIKKQQERANPFDTPRDVTSSFIKLLNILKRQGADITAIKVKDNQSLLSSASKLLRMYISNNLEKNGRRIVLDSTLKNLFSEDQI